MKRKLLFPLVLSVLLSACTTGQPVPGGDMPTSGSTASILENTSEEQPPSSSEAQEAAEPEQEAALPQDEAQGEASSEPSSSVPKQTENEGGAGSDGTRIPAEIGKSVSAELEVGYPGETAESLATYKQTIHNSSTQTLFYNIDITVECLRDGVWELVPGKPERGERRDIGPGQAAVIQGELPLTLKEAAEGLPYRIVRGLVVEHPAPQQEPVLTLVSSFSGGNTFSSDMPPDKTALTGEQQLIVEVETDLSGSGLARFSQKVTNHGGQAVALQNSYSIERYRDEMWQEAPYPGGSVPEGPEGETVLLPGHSAQFEGIFPFTSEQSKRSRQYRILREGRILSPVDGQAKEANLVTAFETGSEILFADAGGSQAGELSADMLRFALKQDTFQAGEPAALSAEILNTGSCTVFVRALHVMSGSTEIAASLREDMAGIRPGQSKKIVLAEIEALDAGEYVLEVEFSAEDGQAQVVVLPFSAVYSNANN